MDPVTIIAVIGIVSPVLTTLINCFFNYFMSKLEFKKKQIEESESLRKNIYLEYLKYAGEYASSHSFSSSDKFSSLHYQLMFLVSRNTRQQLTQLHHEIIHGHYSDVERLLNEIIPELDREFNSKDKSSKL